MMDAIKVLRGCGASGASLTAGTVYAVPGEVSAADAAILVRLGKASPAEVPTAAEPAPEVARPRRTRKAVDSA